MDKDIRQYLHYYLGKARVRHRYVDYEQGVWTIWEKLTIDHYDRLLNDLSIDGIQLELRKLESMSEQEAVEIFNLLNQNSSLPDEGKAREVKRQIGSRLFYNGATNLSGGDWAKIFDYLLPRGFDLFGLIESGAAIDKDKI